MQCLMHFHAASRVPDSLLDIDPILDLAIGYLYDEMDELQQKHFPLVFVKQLTDNEIKLQIPSTLQSESST